MIQKKTASYWMKRLNKRMIELNDQYQSEIASIKQDFSHQIEQLTELLADSIQQQDFLVTRNEQAIKKLKTAIETKTRDLNEAQELVEETQRKLNHYKTENEDMSKVYKKVLSKQ